MWTCMIQLYFIERSTFTFFLHHSRSICNINKDKIHRDRHLTRRQGKHAQYPLTYIWRWNVSLLNHGSLYIVLSCGSLLPVRCLKSFSILNDLHSYITLILYCDPIVTLKECCVFSLLSCGCYQATWLYRQMSHASQHWHCVELWVWHWHLANKDTSTFR